MVDLTAKPFHLNDAAVTWVRSTIDAMTLEEKIGQLFINLNLAFTPEYLDHVLDTYHVGGMRFRGADAATVQAHLRYAQSKSKIPLLIASCCCLCRPRTSPTGRYRGRHPSPDRSAECC